MGSMTKRLLRRGVAGTLMLMAGLMIFQFINPFMPIRWAVPRGSRAW